MSSRYEAPDLWSRNPLQSRIFLLKFEIAGKTGSNPTQRPYTLHVRFLTRLSTRCRLISTSALSRPGSRGESSFSFWRSAKASWDSPCPLPDEPHIEIENFLERVLWPLIHTHDRGEYVACLERHTWTALACEATTSSPSRLKVDDMLRPDRGQYLRAVCRYYELGIRKRSHQIRKHSLLPGRMQMQLNLVDEHDGFRGERILKMRVSLCHASGEGRPRAPVLCGSLRSIGRTRAFPVCLTQTLRTQRNEEGQVRYGDPRRREQSTESPCAPRQDPPAGNRDRAVPSVVATLRFPWHKTI